MKKICILGLGYIGLPLASLFAMHNFKVIGVDINPKIVGSINKGEAHIKEADLDTMVSAATKSGMLVAKTEPENADVYIIAVPTPFKKNKNVDLSFVISAAESIVPYLKKGNLIILESTVPPGTTRDVLLPILKKSKLKIGEELYVAYCSERVLPGKIFFELVENDRVIGGINKESSLLAKELYKTFVKGNIHITDPNTAEFVKLIENTFRDVNIALSNELAKISKKLNIDIWKAIKLANMHPRVNFHYPGPGVGGHCIAVDPWFIIEKAPELSKLIKLGRTINDNMPYYIVDMIEKNTKNIKKSKITILGASYKANVDDTRESPVLVIAEELIKKGFKVDIHDPYVNNFKYPISKDLYNSVKDSSCIVIATDHKIFQCIDIPKVAKLMKNKIIIDTRNCIEKEEWIKHGFIVDSL